MSCCPPNALQYLAPDYSYVGSITALSNGIEFYESKCSSLQSAVIIIPDIFGWNSGRTRNIADFFAANGYYAVVPKLMTPPIGGGNDGDGFVYDFDRSTMRQDVASFPYVGHLQPRLYSITAHLKSLGIQRIAVIGFCWGAWVGSRLVTDEQIGKEFFCFAMGHPSVDAEGYYFGGDTQGLIDRIQIPVLMLPAKGDPNHYREGGAHFLSVHSRAPTSKTIDFPNEDHGFIPRGNVSNPTTHEAVQLALNEILFFFNAHHPSP